jgi:hypothetical protein
MENQVDPLCDVVMPKFYLTQTLSMSDQGILSEWIAQYS